MSVMYKLIDIKTVHLRDLVRMRKRQNRSYVIIRRQLDKTDLSFEISTEWYYKLC
jgi:hypothetical protein